MPDGEVEQQLHIVEAMAAGRTRKLGAEVLRIIESRLPGEHDTYALLAHSLLLTSADKDAILAKILES